jgi:branched-chain amino acid transport system permease protein
VPSRRTVLGLAGTAFVAALPWTFASPHWIGQLGEMIFLALLISSFNLSRGYAGQFSLGQAAVSAVAAYTVANVSTHVSGNLFVSLPAGIVAALVVGAIVGIPALRLDAWTLAVVTFFAVIVLPNVVNLLPGLTGGPNGISGIPAPSIFGWTLDDKAVFALMVVLLALWTAAMNNFVRSRHGDALKTLRTSELLTTAVGISNFRLKFLVYLIAAIPVGIAGALFVYRLQFVSPSPFSFPLVVAIMAGSQLGGAQSAWGALIGAVILQLGPAQSAEFRNASLLVYGVLMLVVGLVLPNGVTGLAAGWAARLRARGRTAEAPAPTPAAPPAAVLAPAGRAGARLDVRDVAKSFGGVRALDGVSLEALPGRVTGLIGANGSGKTTLLNVIAGFLVHEAGSIALDGEVLRGRSAASLARTGIRRTFQTPIVPTAMTTAEAVAIARYAIAPVGIMPTVLRTPAYRRAAAADREAALAALSACDLAAYADREASSLPLGLRRLIEVARVIAGAPRVVLLDEPAAGLEAREIDDLLNVVRALRTASMTVILIEHNFEVIRAVADDVYVLDGGRLIAHGTADDVAADPLVLERYFGGHAPRIHG